MVEVGQKLPEHGTAELQVPEKLSEMILESSVANSCWKAVVQSLVPRKSKLAYYFARITSHYVS